MKRLYIYRIISIILIISLLFSFNMYKEKKTINEILNSNYVFLGDSITDYCNLPEYYDNKESNLINSGIAGNRTKDILNNMQRRVYQYNPSKVYLMIGINDILRIKDSDYIIEDINEIVSNIHKKNSKCEVYVLSILPVNDDISISNEIKKYTEVNNEVVKYNKMIKNNQKKYNYKYIDLYTYLIDGDDNLKKEYSDDGLHPNDNGYKVISNILKKYM